MTLQESDTVIDRAERVKHSIAGQGDPRAVQVTVDGPCPDAACGARVVTTIHADTSGVRCDACGTTFPI